jgi:hypothetical protein
MTEIHNSKPVFDLSERTFQFAKAARLSVETLPKTIANIEDGQQLVKASGSVGGTCIEANELKKIFSSILEESKEHRSFL